MFCRAVFPELGSDHSDGTPFIFAALIKQFVADVAWGELDFLIVDTPPGTSDEHISTVEALRPYKPLGAILVTTPQVGQPAGAELEHAFWAQLMGYFAPQTNAVTRPPGQPLCAIPLSGGPGPSYGQQ